MTDARNKFEPNYAYGSARNTFTVTPHDSTNFTINADALYVGTCLLYTSDAADD